ncbi:MAG: dethiobiotin synthase [Magnetococcales bacterium]|nr:dethiobiotin synthase [Magnetococcales bacterium]
MPVFMWNGWKSMNDSRQGVFVTGTDTGVGKTVAAAWLVRQWSGGYWKPVQSGLEGESDTQTVQRLAAVLPESLFQETFRLTAPLSPHESARRDGVSIGLEDFILPVGKRPLIVEGAGGVMVPLNGRELMVDLMVRLGLPVVLVARTALGTINHTLLSLEALRCRQLEVAGVILSGLPNAVNRAAIAYYGKVRILAEIPWLEPLTSAALDDVLPCDPWIQDFAS